MLCIQISFSISFSMIFSFNVITFVDELITFYLFVFNSLSMQKHILVFFSMLYAKWNLLRLRLYDVKTMKLRHDFWIVKMLYFCISSFFRSEIIVFVLLLFMLYCNINKLFLSVSFIIYLFFQRRWCFDYFSL